MSVIDTTTGSDTSVINAFFALNYTMYPPTGIAGSVFVPNHKYGIDIMLCNFLNSCSQRATTVTISGNSTLSIPTVSIAGDSFRTMFKSDKVYLTSDSYVDSCSDGRLHSDMSYKWSVFDVDSNVCRRID